jgi:hypothetical protein
MSMLALSLWRPWPWAIFHLPPRDAKSVENRSWAPPKALVGTRFAIHAGQRFDDESAERIAEMYQRGPLKENPLAVATGIIGTVTLWGWVHSTESIFPDNRDLLDHGGRLTREQALRVIRSPWFAGPYGWVLAERQLLRTPVECRGMQKLWRVPDDALVKMKAQT